MVAAMPEATSALPMLVLTESIRQGFSDGRVDKISPRVLSSRASPS